MAFDARVYNALIATPSDTEPYRMSIERTVTDWNRTRSEREQALYLARHWSTDSVPEMGNADGQTFLNAQLVDKADVVFAVFHGRLGRPTPRGVSGTAEEITRAADAGKKVHVYFVEAALPYGHDADQFAALQDFRTELEKRGLYRAVDSEADLEGQVRAALEHDLTTLGRFSVAEAPSTGVKLRAETRDDKTEHVDGKGKLKTTHRHRLVVHNDGSTIASKVRVELRSIEARSTPPHLMDATQPDISPGTYFPFPVTMSGGTAFSCRVVMYWTEDDEEKSVTQDVRFG